MKKMFTILILILILTFLTKTQAEQKLLFIGNSISEPWLEMRLKEIADSAVKDLYIQTLSFGGYSLNDHIKSETTHQWIDSLDWDFVVLQESPGILTLDSVQCDQNMFSAFDSLYKLIKKNNPCTEVVLFMPWAVDDGDTNPKPDNNFYFQQEAISQNILRYSGKYFCITSPIGLAWKKVRTDEPWIPLYRDIVHANHTGHFLNACIFYSLLFQESPLNVKNSAFVSEFIGDTLTVYLKKLAEQIVLDSLDKWNFFVNVPQAVFSYQTDNLLKVDFHSKKISSSLHHKWFFGDGDSSFEISPTHSYINDGHYEVTHIVESNCYPSDTAIQILKLPSGIENSLMNDNVRIYPNPNNGSFKIDFGEIILVEIRIYDVFGREMFQNLNNKSDYLNIRLDGFPSGIYFIRINQKNYYKLIISY